MKQIEQSQGIDQYLGVFTPSSSEIVSPGVTEHMFSGIDGPISDPIQLFIEPYPKTKLIDSQFYAGEISPVELVICDNVYKADQYVFQFAPIEPGDPNMIPIGPASIAYSSTTSTFLGPLGLEVGGTYSIMATT